MKKLTSVILIILLTVMLFPVHVMAAASASFSITGPATLAKGQTGTYTIKVTVVDAAAASMKLVYDTNFFELVDGNPIGLWDNATNVNTTATLTTVQLRCKADPGASGTLSLSNLKASRLTGSLDNPTQSVPCSGMSKLVTVPVPTPVPTQGPTPTPTTKPTPKPTPTPATTTVTPAPTTAATTSATTASGATTTTAPTTVVTTATPSAATSPAPGSTTVATTVSGQPNASPGPTSGSTTAGPGGSGGTVDPADSWTVVQSRLSAAPTGALVAAKLPNQPMLPIAVLSLLREHNAKLSLDFGSYGYLIEAGKLGQIPATPSGIDLSVSMAADERITRAAGGNDLYQLHFTHNGELPGRFALTIKADKTAPGTMVYLYRFYSQANVITAVQAASVSADRTVTFEFYQCSDYFVSDKIIAGAMGGFSLTGQQIGSENPGTGAGGPFAGEQQGMLLVVVLCAILLTVLGMMFVYRVGVFKPRQ